MPDTSSAAPQTMLVHGTTVACGSAAILLRGKSGAGKSDLALRFMADQGRWPLEADARHLVADDQTQLTVRTGQIIAGSPAAIAGLLEVRGVGIVGVPAGASTILRLVVDLVPPEMIQRLPAPDGAIELLGHKIAHRRLAPFEASAALKLALLLVKLDTEDPPTESS